MNTPIPIESSSLQQEGFSHGFYTRDGGVSTGIYHGLNVGLGSADRREHVIENRQRVENHIGVSKGKLATLYQVHSPDVVKLVEPMSDDERPKADGMVTRTPGLAIGILTADCGPVLFLDSKNRVAGACHAGWKGATGGVLENTIAAMETLGAKRDSIKAVLGPTISGQNYEVGPEFVERLTSIDTGNQKFLEPSTKADHAMFDLPAYIVNRLKENGVSAEWTGHCTYAHEDRFYSYRRKTHRREADYGRQISVISIKD
ncbi:MAG: peptidoglycan editing factor PgeF [Pseudomonadota bacterium]